MANVKTIELDSTPQGNFVYLVIIKQSTSEYCDTSTTHSVWNTFKEAEQMRATLRPHHTTSLSQVVIVELSMGVTPTQHSQHSQPNGVGFNEWREFLDQEEVPAEWAMSMIRNQNQYEQSVREARRTRRVGTLNEPNNAPQYFNSRTNHNDEYRRTMSTNHNDEFNREYVNDFRQARENRRNLITDFIRRDGTR